MVKRNGELKINFLKGGQTMKHTPWKVLRNELDECWSIYDSRQVRLANIRGAPAITEDEDQHHARLIAAAPELAGACLFALNELGDMTTDDFASGADRPLRQKILKALIEAGLEIPPGYQEDAAIAKAERREGK
jgi:hypothetical protein